MDDAIYIFLFIDAIAIVAGIYYFIQDRKQERKV